MVEGGHPLLFLSSCKNFKFGTQEYDSLMNFAIHLKNRKLKWFYKLLNLTISLL